MKKLTHIILLLIFALIGHTSYAQASIYEEYEGKDLSLKDYNDVLTVIGKTLVTFKDESLRAENNEVFRNFLKKAILLDKSFDYKFDSIKTMSVIKSDDELVKIYNWAFPYEDGTYTYYGFVQLKNKNNTFSVIELYDQSDVIASYKFRSFPPEKWFGALYYKILTRKTNDKTYYTLLGWDGLSQHSTRKIIDVLVVNKYGEINFGAQIFDLYSKARLKPKRRPPSPFRMVYEYASLVSMKLNWDKKENYLIMDHLSPLTSDKKEFANFYGPDLTFDAFRWENNNWTLYDNVKAKNKNKVKKKSKSRKKEKFSGYKKNFKNLFSPKP